MTRPALAGADDGVPAVARRLPADGRVRRQVVHLQRRRRARLFGLAIIGVLTSVVSVFFYLRIVVMMYMTDGTEIVRPRVPAAALAGLALATIAVFYLGVLPTKVLDLARDSISTIF